MVKYCLILLILLLCITYNGCDAKFNLFDKTKGFFDRSNQLSQLAKLRREIEIESKKHEDELKRMQELLYIHTFIQYSKLL